ncbi:peptidylprolyl isomerase [Sorangium cellulosum]|uniref:peptidylprolyl isomerase n=1 Tax=Sorangium cellulosum TaxID=56 RepID=A0A150QJ02_SORCE|nr:peptidylprolyl isomerase [Sorangium cellulosum]KYF67696.1 hypothetical protein BE15_31310 [Sorangium cellulosum]
MRGAPHSAALGYPRGLFWREPEKLDRVVASAAHILIAVPSDKPSRTTLWMPVRQVSRTRAEALRIAQEVLEQLADRPDRFGELARRTSDDEASAPHGGELGLFRVMRLSPPIVDAIAALRPGEISRVVETELGFHILLRKAAPERPSRLSAQRILIGYRGVQAEGLRPGRGDRTRGEALRLAEEARALAAAAPASFDELVQRTSDALDVAGGGDMGAWSTHELGAEPLLMSVLGQAAEGAVTPVIDTRWGFQVLRRSGRVEREELAASTIVIGHQGVSPRFLSRPAERTAEDARRLAEELALEAGGAAGKFEELARAHCDAWLCGGPPAVWTQGRMLPEIEQAVRRLRIGEASAAPVETFLGPVLVRREDPARHALRDEDPRRAPTTTRFPDSSPWQMADYVQKLDGPRLALFSRQFERHITDVMQLAEEERAQLAAILASLSSTLERCAPEERGALIEAAEREAALVLGSRRYAELIAARERWFEAITRM